MTPDRIPGPKKIVAGISAALVLAGVIWLFGYMTGYRLAPLYLIIVSIAGGIVSAAQVQPYDPKE